MSLAASPMIAVSAFGFLQLLLPAAAQSTSGRQDGFCPEVKLDSGEPMNVGCFDYYQGTSRPDMPESINATYALYQNGNADVPYRNWYYNASLRNESETLLDSRSYLAVIIHGFESDSQAGWVVNMTEASLLQRDPLNRNVITVDWKSGAKGPNYLQAALNMFMVGRLTAEFIHRLELKYKLNPDRIHLIGHSLGGQIVGQTTDWLFNQFGTKVGLATGLDVAAVGFEKIDVWPNKSYTKFLEVVHTSSGNKLLSGSLGFKDNFGNVDLYPNGGVVPQPGCPTPPLDIACSHVKATSFYTDFHFNCLRNCRYTGNTCSSVIDAVHKNCTGAKQDICKLVENLRRHANEDQEEIVFMDTTAQDVQDRCKTDYNTGNQGPVTRAVARLLRFVYWALGIRQYH